MTLHKPLSWCRHKISKGVRINVWNWVWAFLHISFKMAREIRRIESKTRSTKKRANQRRVPIALIIEDEFEPSPTPLELETAGVDVYMNRYCGDEKIASLLASTLVASKWRSKGLPLSLPLSLPLEAQAVAPTNVWTESLEEIPRKLTLGRRSMSVGAMW